MNKFLTTTTFFALCLAGLLISGWGERKTWNVKVTIKAETPEGIISNSTVLTFIHAKHPKRLNSSSSSSHGLYGEAPFIEVKHGQYAFALTLYDMYAIFGEYGRHYGLKKSQADLEIKDMLNDTDRPEITSFVKPPFFYFRDIEDPKSIKQISPLTFDWSFGSGIKFKSITYQLTDEPRTRGAVNKILPWIINHRGRFIPTEAATVDGEPNVAGFNRSILARH